MSDLQSFFQYYLIIQFLGLLVWPLTKRVFRRFPDRGWGFSKILGIVLVTYVIWLLGSVRLVAFSRLSAVLLALGVGVVIWGIEAGIMNYELRIKDRNQKTTGKGLPCVALPHRQAGLAKAGSKLREYEGEEGKEGKAELDRNDKKPWSDFNWRLILIEEVLFLAAFGGWSWVRAGNPDIRGLEKFMDYGFVLSALRGKYFPPLDHFLAGSTINYYYFGHLISAVLTRLSGVAPAAGFNLQIANLFALTFLESFVVGVALYNSVVANFTCLAGRQDSRQGGSGWALVSGFLSGLFTAVVGNLHLAWEYLTGRAQNYWYASASRLIPYTINEFPNYSFIVADLHGHVSDLPIVILFLGVVIGVFGEIGEDRKALPWQSVFIRERVSVLAFLLGTMYTTNSWDFAVYGMVLGIVMFYLYFQKYRNLWRTAWELILPLGGVVMLSVLFFLPFWLTVRPFSEGIGLVHNFSPPGLVLILWGFYFFLAFVYLWWLLREKIKRLLRVESVVRGIAGLLGVRVRVVEGGEGKEEKTNGGEKSGANYLVTKLPSYSVSDILALLFLLSAFILLILPELVYLKDIYQPDYYRANTMFKLYYQAWVLFALATAYGTTRVINWSFKRGSTLGKAVLLTVYAVFFLAVIGYPYVGVKTVAGGQKAWRGLDGNHYLAEAFPDDAEAIIWLNENVAGQPVILEAVGESYTDYSRICGNTGLPAVLGWPVHEWLWRGGWDIPGQRQEEVRQIYEGADEARALELLHQHNVEYVYIGGMEREKYPNLNETRFADWGEIVFENDGVRVYKGR